MSADTEACTACQGGGRSRLAGDPELAERAPERGQALRGLEAETGVSQVEEEQSVRAAVAGAEGSQKHCDPAQEPGEAHERAGGLHWRRWPGGACRQLCRVSGHKSGRRARGSAGHRCAAEKNVGCPRHLTSVSLLMRKPEVAAEPANSQPFPLRVTAAVTTEESGQVLGIPWEEEGKGVSRSSLKAHRKPHTLRLQQ